jgi:hypothetical protein
MWDIFENVDPRPEAFAKGSVYQLIIQNSFFPIFLE